MRFLTIGLGLALSIVACGIASEDSGSTGDDQDLISWQKVLDCEGAVVDVDSSERRSLQIVVRDPKAFGAMDAMPYGEVKRPNERIYRGDSPTGIFSPDQFKHFRRYEVVRDASGRRPGIDVIRDGSNLKFRSLDLARSGCEPYSSGTDDVYPAECEVASYVFHSCH